MTELHFGRSQLSGSSGKYTLGKLECSGRSAFSGLPEGCMDLYQIGHVLNGFYPVRKGNKIDMMFCDFGYLFREEGKINTVLVYQLLLFK